MDLRLSNALRYWRGNKSAETGIPMYYILGNKAIENIARHKPSTMENLLNINGMGPKILANYGEEILQIISRYPGPDTTPAPQSKRYNRIEKLIDEYCSIGRPDTALAKELADWRSMVADSAGICETRVFTDPSLVCISALHPKSLACLGNIPGMTTNIVNTYGEDIVKIVSRYPGEDITPSEKMRYPQKSLQQMFESYNRYGLKPDRELTDNLVRLRRKTCRDNGLEACEVFTNAELLDIAALCPRCISNLRKIIASDDSVFMLFADKVCRMIRDSLLKDNVPQTVEASMLLTVDLSSKGLSVEQIALRRGLAIGTIEDHLYHAYRKGYVQKRKLVSAKVENELRPIINEYFSKGVTHPSPIHESLGGKYSYKQIQVLVNDIKRCR